MLFALKQTLILLFFLFLTVAITISSSGLDWTSRGLIDSLREPVEENQEESFFKTIDAFFIENKMKKLYLKAAELTLHTYRDEVSFIRPTGQAFTQDQEPVDYTALRGQFFTARNHLSLFESVDIKFFQDWVQAEEVHYQIDRDDLVAREQVKSYVRDQDTRDQIYIDADQAFGHPRLGELEYEGNVTGRIVRVRAFEPPISFASRRLILEMPLNRVRLFDDVFIKKQGFTATSYRGEIFLENYNKKLKYFVLNDDVKVVEKVNLGRESFERRSFSERLEGFMSESKIVLTGYPRVFQHQDIIKGNKITFYENSEVIEVEDSNTNFIIED